MNEDGPRAGPSAPEPAGAGIGADVLLDSLLEAAPLAMAVYGADGRMTRANDKYRWILRGAAATELSGGDPAGESLVSLVLESSESVYSDELVVDAAKDRHWRCHGHPVRLSGSAPTGVLIVVEDVTRATRLEVQAQTDPLTGLLNHGAFHERLAKEAERARRHGHPLALALLDVDDFKAINDTFGHPVGDRVLRDVAALLREHVRTSDVLARIGGDEFALLMPDTHGASAAVIAERAHGAVGAASVGGGQRVTFSIGVCELDQAKGAEELARLADRALYWAKTHGRDMVWRHSADYGEPHGALAPVGEAARLAPRQAAAAVRALARSVDLKHAATRQHSDRVAELAARLAEELGWAPERVQLLRQAAVVHDVGKVGVPDAVLLKPDRLTAEEFETIRGHSELGAQLAAEILADEQTAWVRSHHERPDGAGYPDGLSDEEIPEGARIIAVADSYDAMVSDRPYRHGRDPTEALGELRRCAGTQFAPEVVAAFQSPRFVRQADIHSNQERARAANRLATPDRNGRLVLRCECAAPSCPERLRLGGDELQAARVHQRRFVVCDGHEQLDVEQVVARTSRFVVIEKLV